MMMDADPYNPNDPEFQVSQFIDGELSDEERRAFEARMALDEALQSCRRDFEDLNRELRNTAETLAVDWSRFEHELKGRLDAERLGRRFRRWIWLSGGGAIAAAIGLVAVTLFLQQPSAKLTARTSLVSKIEVGPQDVRTAHRATETTATFHFSHGRRTPESVELRREDRSLGSVVVACVSPAANGVFESAYSIPF